MRSTGVCMLVWLKREISQRSHKMVVFSVALNNELMVGGVVKEDKLGGVVRWAVGNLYEKNSFSITVSLH